jgi:integrase
MPLVKLGPQHLQRLYEQRLAAGASTTTVHHLHAVLHKALDQAMRWGLVVRNVSDLVDPPRTAHHEMAVLSPEHVKQLLAAATGGPVEALLTVAVTTGMLRGELLALQWRDVDLDRHAIAVRGTMQKGPAGLEIAEPKTARSRRQVELSSVAVKVLRRHRREQAEQRLLVGHEWNDHDLVFPSALGRPQEGRHCATASSTPFCAKPGCRASASTTCATRPRR